MSKILAIADVHIFDYPQRNPQPRYRLHQTKILSQNIIKVAKQEGADIIVLAGDILEKSINRPYVLAEVKLFLDTLMNYFQRGFLIYGNHDIDNKGSEQDITDSSLGIMLPPNLYYADQKELVIDNSRIAFSNWRPEFDLSWINGCVDVLFTHATINYSVDSEKFKSQVLDDSKFMVAICGDIHKPGEIGKFISIGNCQKCKLSDSDSSTGIIYDCVTKEWKRINLNPDDNLMKFQYTPNKFQEGWDEKTGTWYIYRPVNSLSNNKTGLDIPAWQEIEHLIDAAIIQSGLQGVHGEILKRMKNKDIKEIDFNFTLTRFYCKNWRSIDEAELFFEDGDKILITGHNGSGKSSLLSALKYAFIENRFIKDFIQFGTKECLTEVDFVYQGNMYRIQRGSKKYGLFINGEAQRYNNKREFEDDVRLRFPFIEYLNMFYFDSTHNRLIGELTPEKKSEIVSKFFKLDKIDCYNEEANLMLEGMKVDAKKWQEEIDKSQKLLDYIDGKLSLIQIPKTAKVELEKYKQEGLELQKKSKMWSDYKVFVANITARIDTYKETLNILGSKKSKFRKMAVIKSDVDQVRKRIDEINSVHIPALNNIEIQYNKILNEYNQINREGSKVQNEWINLGKTRICPSCGQEIKNTDSLNKHKKELEIQLKELAARRDELANTLKGLYEEKQNADNSKSQFSQELSSLNNKLAELKSEQKEIEINQKNIEETTKNLNNCEKELSNIGIPEEVYLPENFMGIMAEIENNINTWNEFEKLMSDRKTTKIAINNSKSELMKIKDAAVELQNYIKLTGPTGKIYEEIMTKLADQFSDNQVKYEVVTYNFRKKDRLDLTLSFNNNGNWVGYQACSSGQQTVLDINFMSKVITRMGLIVMDEFLKHLDPKNHDICIETISNMNIGCIMLSSHMESIASFYNKSCRMELNDSGVTKITFE